MLNITMKLAHPVVFLFGAGATRGGFQANRLPPPVDADFFEIAGQIKGHGTPALARKVLQDVHGLYGRIFGIGLENYYRDIETRAKIGSFAKSANKPKDWKKRQRNLEEFIRRVIIQTTCKSKAKHLKPVRSRQHAKILSKLQKGDSVLTFNYDLVIEESFGSTDVWTPIGGYGDSVHGVRSEWCTKWLEGHGVTRASRSKIRLLKLHGSINWTLYKTGEIKLKDRPFVVRAGRFETVSILPPGWNKRIDKNPYKQLWREARLKLERCKTIVIIGYSLPEADLLAKALFAEVVRARRAGQRYFKQIHLADPSGSVKQKLVDLFVPALNAQSKVFRYHDMNELAQVLSRRETSDASS